MEKFDFVNNNIKKLNKMLVLFVKNNIENNHHHYGNHVRLPKPCLSIISQGYYENYTTYQYHSVNVIDLRFVKLMGIFQGNPLIYSMMKYRDDMNEFYKEEFVDIDKMMEYYKTDPMNFSEYYHAVKRIENWFLECKFNPKYGYCQRLLQNQFDEIY